MDVNDKKVLSIDAKLIAASNLAVAEAIWATYQLSQTGTPTQSAETLVGRSFRQAMKQIDELEEKTKQEAAANPTVVKPLV